MGFEWLGMGTGMGTISRVRQGISFLENFWRLLVALVPLERFVLLKFGFSCTFSLQPLFTYHFRRSILLVFR